MLWVGCVSTEAAQLGIRQRGYIWHDGLDVWLKAARLAPSLRSGCPRNHYIMEVPFFPTCSISWDATPRYGENACVAINRSPDQFEHLLRTTRHFSAKQN